MEIYIQIHIWKCTTVTISRDDKQIKMLVTSSKYKINWVMEKQTFLKIKKHFIFVFFENK